MNNQLELQDDFVLERIEELCKAKGISHYALAKASGVHQSSLSTLMNRKSTPNFFTLRKLCEGLDISLSKFFAIGEDPYSVLTENQRNLVETYDELDEIGKQMLLAYAKGLLDMKKAQNL